MEWLKRKRRKGFRESELGMIWWEERSSRHGIGGYFFEDKFTGERMGPFPTWHHAKAEVEARYGVAKEETKGWWLDS